MTLDQLTENIKQWAEDKGLINEANTSRQFMKIIEELGETASADLKDKPNELKDGIGDVFVTLIIYAYTKGLEPKECLLHAYNEIKDRKGRLVNGSFIKDS